MKNDLIQHGIVPRKSRIAQATPEMQSNLNFWRGLIDGDGSVLVTKQGKHHYAGLFLSGSYVIVSQFVQYIEKQFGFTAAKINCADRVPQLSYSGRKAKAIIDHLWPDGCVCLDRKRKKVDQVKNLINPRY